MTNVPGQGDDYKSFLKGYCGALADLHREFGQSAAVYGTVVNAGLTYHDFKDAGAEVQDLGEIARARDIWKASPTYRETSKVSRETSRA